MKQLQRSLYLLIIISVFTSCSAGNKSTLKVNFNTNTSEDRVIEFKNIEANPALKSAIAATFQVTQGTREISSQIVLDPVSKTHSLLISPTIDNSQAIQYISGIKASSQFPQMAHAELWNKVGGKFVDRKYIGGKFVKTDSVRVPDECTDHSFYIKYEGPGWESNLIGYRFYLDWRNAVDIFGKKTDKMILENVGQDGYESYHSMNDWGMDNFKVGSTLGIGTIAYWNGKSAERVAKTDSMICKILADGPLRAMIRTNYYGWKTNDFKANMISYLSIDANSRLTKEVLLFDKAPTNVCTGMIKDSLAEYFKIVDREWTAIGTWGKQSLNNDNLGLVVLVKNSSIISFEADKENYVVVLKPENNQASWYMGAAWELEPKGITTLDGFKKYINQQLELLNHPDKVD
jgi:hypothetical protein